MKHEIVSIRDRAVETFGRPFYVPKLGAALRAFNDEVNRPADGNELNKHPEDHDLYHLGTFDDQDGSFTALPQPRILAKGNEVKI